MADEKSTGANPMSQEVMTKESVSKIKAIWRYVPQGEVYQLCTTIEKLRAELEKSKEARRIYLKELVESSDALRQEADELRQRAEAAEAGAALMRQALEVLAHHFETGFNIPPEEEDSRHRIIRQVEHIARTALKDQAGSAFLARHKRAMEALKPFAAWCEAYEKSQAYEHSDAQPLFDYNDILINLGMLRLAQLALREEAL